MLFNYVIFTCVHSYCTTTGMMKCTVAMQNNCFVSFEEVGIFDIYFDPKGPSPGTIKEAVRWKSDQSQITFTFQHGRKSCCVTPTIKFLLEIFFVIKYLRL